MRKEYIIKLDEQRIGITLLEKADAPMGVVFGLMEFDEIGSGYEFFRAYCLEKNIVINLDDPDERFIDTQVIPELRVYTPEGNELKGQAGNHICGMESEGFEITILGYSYPEYEQEFPHHVKEYKERFK